MIAAVGVGVAAIAWAHYVGWGICLPPLQGCSCDCHVSPLASGIVAMFVAPMSALAVLLVARWRFAASRRLQELVLRRIPTHGSLWREVALMEAGPRGPMERAFDAAQRSSARWPLIGAAAALFVGLMAVRILFVRIAPSIDAGELFWVVPAAVATLGFALRAQSEWHARRVYERTLREAQSLDEDAGYGALRTTIGWVAGLGVIVAGIALPVVFIMADMFSSCGPSMF